MKNLLLFSLFSICVLQVNSQYAYLTKAGTLAFYSSFLENKNDETTLGLQPGVEGGKMSAAIFKNQEYCRAEVERFEFEVSFKVVSATVYFSGANFRNIEIAKITGSSLKPIKPQMERCIPGTMVVFDDIKVIGPDNKLRTIPGTSYLLF